MRQILRSRVAAVTIGAVAVIGLGAGGATAAAMIDSGDIRNNSVQQEDLARNSVGQSELIDNTVGPRYVTDELLNRINQSGPRGPQGPRGAQGPQGDQGPQGEPGLSELEADGPYPGASQLPEGEGDNSTAMWSNDGTRQTSWVQCAPGKVALGGGYTLAADAGDAAPQAVHVATTQPTQIENGQVVYNPIEGDAAGSFLPNGWLVEGYNNGTGDVIVRPWVTCAKIAAN